MKRLLCLALCLVMLCGCSGPALSEGYYLVPLEETGGFPMYFCLESGGTGYLHAMGADQELTWTPRGLEGDFSDCVPTENGLEFSGEDGPVLCTYGETLPESYTQPILRPGFYIPEGEEFDSLMCYAQLRADGTGEISIMGMTQPIEWEPTKFYFGDMTAAATEEGFVLRDSVTTNFTWVGDSLPEGYLPDPPPAGTYYISSIGFRGNVSFFGAKSDRRRLVLNADGTGCLTFDGEDFDLTWDGAAMVLKGGYAFSLLYMPDQGEDEPLLAAYALSENCPIEADSIAFRLQEGE